MAERKRGLGRGLGALMDEPDAIVEAIEKDDNSEAGITEIKISNLETNPYQPRKTFDETALKELANSIEQDGIVQPIIVRKNGNKYQIVSGERRFRAAKIADLKKIPVVVRDLTDNSMAEIAIIENLQREDLNVIEEARGIDSYMKQLSLTQDQAATKLGKSRPAITNMLRLLNLPESVQELVVGNDISMGHARAILGLDSESDMLSISKKIVDDGLSVRQTEDLIRGNKGKATSNDNKRAKKVNNNIYQQEVINQLEDKFATKVNLGKKKIEIVFNDDDDLNRILDILGIDLD